MGHLTLLGLKSKIKYFNKVPIWQDVHVFAREKDCDGKRVYIVATLPQFWFKYTRYTMFNISR